MNINTLLLDAAGRDVYSIGGPTAWKTGFYRGYLYSLEWFVGAKSVEPILCLQDAKQGHESGVFGICLSSIGNYADESGGVAPTCFKACWDALPMLGKAQIVMEAKLLQDVVMHFVSDLILMPPAPMAVRKEEIGRPLIEVELKNENTGKVEREVAL